MAAHGVSRSASVNRKRSRWRLDLRLLRWLGAELYVLDCARTQLDRQILRNVRKQPAGNTGPRCARSQPARLVSPESSVSESEMVVAQQRELPAKRTAAGAA